MNTVQRVRGISNTTAEVLKNDLESKSKLLRQGILTAAHGQRMNSQLDEIESLVKQLRQVAGWAVDGFKPEPVQELPPSIQKLIEDRARQLMADPALNPANKGSYVTKSGRVFKTKPGRKAS